MNKMIESSYDSIMKQITPKDSVYKATLYGEDIDIDDEKMRIVLAYNLGYMHSQYKENAEIDHLFDIL